MRMGLRLHGTGFGAAEQFVGGDRPLAELQVLLRIVGDALRQLVGMRQKKVEVEGACLIEHEGSGIQSGAFVRIGSSLVAPAQGKQQFGGARGLAHAVVLLLRTNVLNPSSVLRLDLVVKLVQSSLLTPFELAPPARAVIGDNGLTEVQQGALVDGFVLTDLNPPRCPVPLSLVNNSLGIGPDGVNRSLRID